MCILYLYPVQQSSAPPDPQPHQGLAALGFVSGTPPPAPLWKMDKNVTKKSCVQFEHSPYILTTHGFSVEEMHLKCSSKMDLLGTQWGWIVDGVKLELPASRINFFQTCDEKRNQNLFLSQSKGRFDGACFHKKKMLPRISQRMIFYLCLFLLLRMKRMMMAVTSPQRRRITPTAIRNICTGATITRFVN